MPVALSTLSRTLSAGELPEWVHPSQLLPAQIPEDVFPDVASTVSSRAVLIESAVLAGAGVSETWSLSDLLRESSVPESCDLDQTKHLSIPDAGPPKPAIRQQFLTQSRPPEFALLGLVAFLGLLRVALYLNLSWIKYIIFYHNVPLFSAFVLVSKERIGERSY